MILLANPNTNRATTQAMGAILRDQSITVREWTAPQGPPVILTPDALDAAALHVARLSPPKGCQGVIVAAFGDPGARALAARLMVPVIGIGAAAAQAAGRGGRRFAVVTTTPALRQRIDALMLTHAGTGRYLGCHVTDGPPLSLMADPVALDHALLALARRAAAQGAQAVIIGGGPLAQAAQRLASQSPVPLIQPLTEAALALAAIIAQAPDA